MFAMISNDYSGLPDRLLIHYILYFGDRVCLYFWCLYSDVVTLNTLEVPALDSFKQRVPNQKHCFHLLISLVGICPIYICLAVTTIYIMVLW